MKRSRGRVVHVETVEEFDQRLGSGVTSLRGWRVRALDLTGRHDALVRHELAGATFVGCVFADGDAELARSKGALVLPTTPDVPVETARSSLYTPAELYDAPSYDDTLDAHAYGWSQRPSTREKALAQALHDHAVDLALESWAHGRRLVGVMGGHTARRGEPVYAEAAALGRALGRDRVVATGGGPGAMEAANLGAWLADRPEDDLRESLGMLAEVQSYRPSVTAWVRRAFDVRARFPDGRESLGIPTWHYGHEPPNVFASAIAKYFRNSTREAILLEICDGGIVFLPGTGGTVQEIFQDACENYYADESAVAPMVLVGASYWTEELPAWPLLRTLAKGRPMESQVHLVDSVAEAADLFAR